MTEASTGVELEVRAANLSPTGQLTPETWTMLAQIGNTVYDTEFVPAGLRGRKAAVMACLLYGNDQGFSPMVSLSTISVIEGRPTMSAAAQVAKIRAAGHKISREELFGVDEEADTIVGIRAVGERKDGATDSFTFTKQMALRAGLLTKKNWMNYPEAMMWARAASQLARQLFPDVFLGVSFYDPDELEHAGVVEAAPAVAAATDEPEQPEEAAKDGSGATDAVEPVFSLGAYDKLSVGGLKDFLAGETGQTFTDAQLEALLAHEEANQQRKGAVAALTAELEARKAKAEASDEDEPVEEVAAEDVEIEEPSESAEDVPAAEAKTIVVALEDGTVLASVREDEPLPAEIEEGYTIVNVTDTEMVVAPNEPAPAEEPPEGAVKVYDASGRTVGLVQPHNVEDFLSGAHKLEGYVVKRQREDGALYAITDAEQAELDEAEQRAAEAEEGKPRSASEAIREAASKAGVPSTLLPPLPDESAADVPPVPEEPAAFVPEPLEEERVDLPADPVRLLALKVQLACRWMEENVPTEKTWRVEAVVASAGKIWTEDAIHSIGDLAEWQLQSIWDAAGKVTTTNVHESVEQMLETNPAAALKIAGEGWQAPEPRT